MASNGISHGPLVINGNTPASNGHGAVNGNANNVPKHPEPAVVTKPPPPAVISKPPPPAVIPTAHETAVIPYTTFHLSAVAFIHPGGRPSHIKQCCAPNENAGRPKDQHIRVYHAEPSHYSYNHGCYVIRESRYNTQQGWHAPKVDDLVADDAIAGSAVCAIGWWQEEHVWSVSKSKPLNCLYSMSELTYQLRTEQGLLHRQDGQASGGASDLSPGTQAAADSLLMSIQRFNATSFTPKEKDGFERELPDPAKMVPPAPGWTQTILLAPGAHPTSASDRYYFPTITPLPNTKIAAVRSEDGKIHVFYQASDNTIRQATCEPDKGWTVREGPIIAADKAKPGTPLTAIAGGWDELRLFYATTGEMLAGIYGDNHCPWTPRRSSFIHLTRLASTLTHDCSHQLSTSRPTSSFPRPCSRPSPGTTHRPTLRCASS